MRCDVQHREKGRDDCAVLRGLCATRECTIGGWGNGERPNAPPAQNSADVTTRRWRVSFNLSLAVQRSSAFSRERTRQSREGDGTTSTNQPENQRTTTKTQHMPEEGIMDQSRAHRERLVL